jgi:hypothetical protein
LKKGETMGRLVWFGTGIALSPLGAVTAIAALAVASGLVGYALAKTEEEKD